jgi:transketolase
LAALRAIPNLNVMRPADSVECAECWEIALLSKTTPSILALTRQGVPLLRTASGGENLSAKGAYVLIEPKGARDVTLIGTGSELALAVEAAKTLEGEGIGAAVVSMPCWELFEAQTARYQESVLGVGPRVAVEAASAFGWSQWLGPNSAFIGMHGFGASAPAQHLYKHFGITAEAIAAAARELIGKR